MGLVPGGCQSQEGVQGKLVWGVVGSYGRKSDFSYNRLQKWSPFASHQGVVSISSPIPLNLGQLHDFLWPKSVMKVMLGGFSTLLPCKQAWVSLVRDERSHGEEPSGPSQDPDTCQTCKWGRFGPVRLQQTSQLTAHPAADYKFMNRTMEWLPAELKLLTHQNCELNNSVLF